MPLKIIRKNILLIGLGCLLLTVMYSQTADATKIPQWVNNLFAWHSHNKISNDEVSTAVRYLMENKIVQITSPTAQANSSKKITTVPETPPLNAVQIPTPTKSWQFDSKLQNLILGHAKLQKSSDGNFLQLNGDGYMRENVNSIGNLTALTISSWVKPNYEQGSQEFTIVGKQGAFELAIYNNLPPAKSAVFSVFDGIKWATVASNSTIPDQQWTHVASTFDGKTIKMYVNGKMEASSPIIGIPVFTTNGLLTTKDFTISSNQDTTIGAYFDKIRGHTRSMFSGSIKDVRIFNSALSPSQILQLYKPITVSSNTKTITPQITKTNTKIPNISFSIDKKSYSQNDTMIISGLFNTKSSKGALPIISIFDPSYHIIVTNHPQLGSDGKILVKIPISSSIFRTAGNYTIAVNYGSSQAATKFFFSGTQ